MSRLVKMPMRIFLPIVHLATKQLGLHEWLRKRPLPPFLVASMNWEEEVVQREGYEPAIEATHHFSIQRHEVEVTNPCGSVVLHTLGEGCWANHLADVLVDEGITSVPKARSARISLPREGKLTLVTPLLSELRIPSSRF